MNSFTSISERPVFVNIQDEYKCVECKDALIQPMQLECGHRICKSCLDILMNSNMSLICPSKDLECEETKDLSQTFLDKSLAKEMLKLDVFCKYHNYDCKHTSPWNKINEHELKCEYKEKCCQYCQQIIPIEQYKEHLDNVCLKIQYKCPFNCSIEKFTRIELKRHKEICLKKPSFCKYKSLGCNFEDVDEEVKKHENNKSIHFELTINSLELMNNKIKIMEDEFEKDKILINEIQINMIKNMEKERMPQLQILNNNEIEIKFNDINSSINNLKKDFEEIASTKSSNSLPDDMRLRLIKHEETIAEHDKLLISQDLRIQCLETANYNGELVWKITDFRRRKQQALNGQVLSLYSQPFYSDHYGYKMCARVYLNGDGIGKGTHLSLFFVIMQGDFDDILIWPFCRKVTFMLLDQKTNKRHLVDSFKPDKNSSSFQKPTTSMNIASGCPLFVPHTTLENIDEMYLRNNLIFLRIIVDKEDI